jgi:hypothetical protein
MRRRLSSALLANRYGHLYHRAVFNTGPAAGAAIFNNTARAFANFDFKISGGSFDGFQIRIGDQLNVQMPADLDQYR